MGPDELKKELDAIRSSLGSMDLRIKTVHKELKTIGQRLDALQQRVGTTEKAQTQQSMPDIRGKHILTHVCCREI